MIQGKHCTRCGLLAVSACWLRCPPSWARTRGHQNDPLSHRFFAIHQHPFPNKWRKQRAF